MASTDHTHKTLDNVSLDQSKSEVSALSLPEDRHRGRGRKAYGNALLAARQHTSTSKETRAAETVSGIKRKRADEETRGFAKRARSKQTETHSEIVVIDDDDQDSRPVSSSNAFRDTNGTDHSSHEAAFEINRRSEGHICLQSTMVSPSTEKRLDEHVCKDESGPNLPTRNPRSGYRDTPALNRKPLQGTSASTAIVIASDSENEDKAHANSRATKEPVIAREVKADHEVEVPSSKPALQKMAQAASAFAQLRIQSARTNPNKVPRRSEGIRIPPIQPPTRAQQVFAPEPKPDPARPDFDVVGFLHRPRTPVRRGPEQPTRTRWEMATPSLIPSVVSSNRSAVQLPPCSALFKTVDDPNR